VACKAFEPTGKTALVTGDTFLIDGGYSLF
jgi:hypothetical protein